jgi:hypothetical protein
MSHPVRAEPFPEWHAGAPSLLTSGDLDIVQAMLAEAAPSWSAELNQAAIDESTIVVVPEGAN